jgi:hypothetical protein
MYCRRSETQGTVATRVVAAVAIAITIAALADQLTRASADRTWAGKVFGVVPYNFRMPTTQTLRDAVWNSGNANVFTGRAFGVGWTINFYPLWKLLKSSRCCG